jgi:hypothetical protein
MKLSERPASDLVMIVIAATIAIMLLLSAFSILLIELIHPETDTDPIVRVETEILAVLTGAVVGFLGGRSVGRSEANGEE